MIKKVQTKNKKWTKTSLIASAKKGIITNSFMEQELKRLGLSHADILKIKPKPIQGGSNQFGPVKL
tara:strand:+ start:1616 stop:1813 length:198 start_codon:yes stop_codon:yes gene_type:complete